MGLVQSLSGAYSAIVVVAFYPRVAKRFGLRRVSAVCVRGGGGGVQPIKAGGLGRMVCCSLLLLLRDDVWFCDVALGCCQCYVELCDNCAIKT